MMSDSSISLLLGAGFSIPAGYPSANKVGKEMVTTNIEDLYVSDNQTLAKNKSRVPIDRYKQQPIRIMLRLIKIFHCLSYGGNFNYEHFYDFYKKLCRLTYISPKILDLDKYIQQFVALCIDDREVLKSSDKYVPFIQQINQLASKSIIHIHTLNHDNLCEELFGIDISDGYTNDNTPYNQNIPVFTGEFVKSTRLYKLHGSLDQYIYYYQTIQNKIDYIKCDGYVDLSNIENLKDGNVNINQTLVPDYLTGTTSKICRYREPHYDYLFQLFAENLRESNIWIIIGYSGNDSVINKYLIDNYHNNKVLIYDPYPKTPLIRLASKIGANLIKGSVENINLTNI